MADLFRVQTGFNKHEVMWTDWLPFIGHISIYSVTSFMYLTHHRLYCELVSDITS